MKYKSFAFTSKNPPQILWTIAGLKCWMKRIMNEMQQGFIYDSRTKDERKRLLSTTIEMSSREIRESHSLYLRGRRNYSNMFTRVISMTPAGSLKGRWMVLKSSQFSFHSFFITCLFFVLIFHAKKRNFFCSLSNGIDFSGCFQSL